MAARTNKGSGMKIDISARLKTIGKPWVGDAPGMILSLVRFI